MRRSWIIAALLLATPAQAELSEFLRARLSERWIPRPRVITIGGDEERDPTVPEARWRELIAVARADTAVSSLVDDVARGLGFEGPADLRRLVYLCDVRRSITIGEPEPELRPDEMERGTEGHLRPAFRRTPEGRYVVDLARTSICLDREDTLLDAFSTFVHELTHLKGAIREAATLLNPGRIDVTAYRDANDYAERHLDRFGGELDAFIAQTPAELRLIREEHVYPDRTPAAHQFFDADGNVTDRAGLRRLLLDNHGYRARFRGEFVRAGGNP
jgi:hypothetical protein